MENKKVFKIYKLEKEYPGSPKKDTIVIESYDNYYSPISSIIFSDKKLIEDYPENWKLQTSPDFIVRSIVSPDGYVRTGKQVMYEHAYGMYPNYEIHTIKRTSDGEEFKIGDIITSPFNQNMSISNFKLKGKDLIIFYNGDIGAICFVRGCIDMINKVKTKLFTTEDGVEIFEGDTFAHTSGATEPKVLVATKKHLNYSLPMDKLFSTKEKAEYYVKMNKKEFSRNQIINLLDQFYIIGGMREYFINELNKQ